MPLAQNVHYGDPHVTLMYNYNYVRLLHLNTYCAPLTTKSLPKLIAQYTALWTKILQELFVDF